MTFRKGQLKKEHHNKQTRTHTLTSCYPLIGPSKEITVDAHPRYTRYSNFKSRVGSLAPTHSHLGIVAGCIPSPQLNMCFILREDGIFLKVLRCYKLQGGSCQLCCFIFCQKITLSAVLGSVKCQDPSNWTDLLD